MQGLINFRHVRKMIPQWRNQYGQVKSHEPECPTHLACAISDDVGYQAGETLESGNTVSEDTILERHKQQGKIDRWTAETAVVFSNGHREIWKGEDAKKIMRAFAAYIAPGVKKTKKSKQGDQPDLL